jgi:hypothetical protein
METDFLMLLVSLGYRSVKILVAIFLLFLVLRIFDKISQKDFNLFDLIDDKAGAAALYYGLRFIGASYLVSQVWGV